MTSPDTDAPDFLPRKKQKTGKIGSDIRWKRKRFNNPKHQAQGTLSMSGDCFEKLILQTMADQLSAKADKSRPLRCRFAAGKTAEPAE